MARAVNVASSLATEDHHSESSNAVGPTSSGSSMPANPPTTNTTEIAQSGPFSFGSITRISATKTNATTMASETE
jgi:hypothetical protein